MYKDKDKQREADRQRQRRRRDKIKAKGVTNQGVTQGVTDIKTAFNTGELSRGSEMRDMKDVFPKTTRFPTHKRGKDIKCITVGDQAKSMLTMAMLHSKAQHFITGKPKPYQMTVMERLFYRPAHLLKPGETNFVSLPGRACYG